MKKYYIFCAMLIALFSRTDKGNAELLDKVSLHGFGSWAAGITDNENRYFLWDKEGNLEHLEAALNIHAEVYNNVDAYFQASFNRTWAGTESSADYAFAEWSYSDQLILRGGKVNAPFMLYSEIYDVRTVRPFFNLPSGIYHDTGVKAYKGIGLTGRFSPQQNWDIQYDLYGGSMVQHSNRKILYREGTVDKRGVTTDDSWSFAIPDQVVENMVGWRVFVTPPIDKFRFGISAYTGEQRYYEEDTQNEYGKNPREQLLVNILNEPIYIGFSFEYLADKWEARCEYLLTWQDNPEYTSHKIYAETAYRFTEHWQVALRYEYNTADEFATEPFLSEFESLREHKELTFGLNYWFTPRLAAKGSFHIVQGNSFTVPSDDVEYIDSLRSGAFEEETRLALFGIQFSF